MKTGRQHFLRLKPLRLFLLTTSIYLLGGCQSSFLYNCHDGGEIDAKKRLDITKVSLQFVQAAFTGDVDSTYNQFTEAAKANTSRDQLGGVLKAFKQGGPFEGLRVERIM